MHVTRYNIVLNVKEDPPQPLKSELLGLWWNRTEKGEKVNIKGIGLSDKLKLSFNLRNVCLLGILNRIQVSARNLQCQWRLKTSGIKLILESLLATQTAAFRILWKYDLISIKQNDSTKGVLALDYLKWKGGISSWSSSCQPLPSRNKVMVSSEWKVLGIVKKTPFFFISHLTIEYW